ncbi:MAG: DNA cytosine methyltransferase [Anaerolineales bacterium]|nr:DNA cytosine methyltransferase [Anaerolineales bacterium]
MRVGSLFAGIGGFDLGLERAGFDIAWQVEIDPYCQRVLAKHWPAVQRYGDIRAVDWQAVEPVDLLCGGFPCQDISLAGKGAGLSGERSGLWFEYAKAIDALKPRYVLIENVAALRSRGLDQVLGALAALGYDAEWHCIPACAVGAPHRRDRVWIVAHSSGTGGRARHQPQNAWAEIAHRSEPMADTSIKQRDRWLHWTCGWEREPQEALLDAGGGGREETWMSIPEPLLGRVAHGVSNRVDRLKGLGNAIVPQIAEMIGRWIQFREEITT